MLINVVKDRIRFAFDTKNYYNSHTVINCVRYDYIENANHISARNAVNEIDVNFAKQFNYKYLLALLNSNLMNWYFVNFLSESLHFYPNDVKSLPIKNIAQTEQQPFIEKADLMLAKKAELQQVSKEFTTYLSAKYNINSLSKNLLNWYKITDNQFLSELAKIKTDILYIDESKLLQYFNAQKQFASKIDNEIEIIDNEIDNMVYKLYKVSNNQIF